MRTRKLVCLSVLKEGELPLIDDSEKEMTGRELDDLKWVYLKRTSWYMSDHYICLQYLLFLSLIFHLC